MNLDLADARVGAVVVGAFMSTYVILLAERPLPAAFNLASIL